ncbi:MAG: TolC family protein [Verrucomicrobia bacterium]|nr:TolC family protein [Verrucomicrobiota bacterium]MBI3869255.1 TolC family protein [Verrucomicrobiota bacterium]
MDTLKAPCSNPMIRKLLLVAWLALASVAVPAAEPADAPPATRKLSLGDCFQLALEHNLNLQIERHNNRIQGIQLAGSYGVYDPLFRFNARKDHLDSPDIFNPRKVSGDIQYDIDTVTYGAGIGGKLPTGGFYDLSGMLTRWKDFSDFGGLVPPIRTNEYGFTTMLTLSQPLLKNFWIDADRLVIQVNKKNLKISELALLKTIMNTIGNVESAYYDAISASEALRIQRATYEKTRKLLGDVQARIQAGTMPALEEKLLDYDVASLAEDVVSAERADGDAQASLRNLLTEDLKDWVGARLEVTDKLPEVEEQFNQIESWRDAMTKRPEVLQMQLNLEKQDIALRYDRNQLYPSLDISGTYGLNAVQPGLENTVTRIERASHSVYGYGAIFTIPLGNRTARSKYKVDQEGRKQAVLQMKQLEMQILTDVENSGRQLTTTWRRIEPAKRARDLAEQVLQSEEGKILLQQTTSFNVVEARRRLTTAQLGALHAAVDYNKARLQVAQSQGEILERNAIAVNFK